MGVVASATFGVGVRIDDIVNKISQGINFAALPMVSQNIAARQEKRAEKVVHWAWIYGAISTAAFIIAYIVFGKQMFMWFSKDDPQVIMYLRRCEQQTLLVVTNNSDAPAKTQWPEEVKNGRNYLIFPEGTRSKNGNRMGEFKSGSFKAATKAKCPIVPIAIIDSYLPFDRNSIDKVDVQIHILPPIPYEEYQGMKTTQIAQMVRSRIEKVITENEHRFNQK